MDFEKILKNVWKELLPDGTYRILQDLDLSYKGITSLEGLNISIVDGFFACSYNELTSLKGCPRIVNGIFLCENNKLTSLKFVPTIIKDGFYCQNNKLK